MVVADGYLQAGARLVSKGCLVLLCRIHEVDDHVWDARLRKSLRALPDSSIPSPLLCQLDLGDGLGVQQRVLARRLV